MAGSLERVIGGVFWSSVGSCASAAECASRLTHKPDLAAPLRRISLPSRAEEPLKRHLEEKHTRRQQLLAQGRRDVSAGANSGTSGPCARLQPHPSSPAQPPEAADLRTSFPPTPAPGQAALDAVAAAVQAAAAAAVSAGPLLVGPPSPSALEQDSERDWDSESAREGGTPVPLSPPPSPLSPDESIQYPSCPKWRRVLLKVSGEALAGDGTSNIDPKVTSSIAKEVAVITRLGVQVGIVVGGGNFFRGAAWAGASGLDRASADHIGMLATVMNAIFLQGSLEALGVPTRVQTAISMCEVAEPYIRRRAIRHLEKGRVVIFAAGTGNPFFTTDTAAALRAAEIDAEVVLKGTNVDGVYDCDPRKNPSARLFSRLSLREVTVQNLRVMDITAATLCAENSLPVVVFNLSTPGNITRALSGEPVGTVVTP